MVVSCALAAVGIGVLAGVDWRTLRLGRGEGETILSSFFFAAQIFWLERPAFARNRTAHATVVMFAVLTATLLPGAGVARGRLARGGDGDLRLGAIFACLLVLTLFCTLCTFTLMNHWQRELEGDRSGVDLLRRAGVDERVRVVLAGVAGALDRVEYANEAPTARLLCGGRAHHRGERLPPLVAAEGGDAGALRLPSAAGSRMNPVSRSPSTSLRVPACRQWW